MPRRETTPEQIIERDKWHAKLFELMKNPLCSFVVWDKDFIKKINNPSAYTMNTWKHFVEMLKWFINYKNEYGLKFCTFDSGNCWAGVTSICVCGPNNEFLLACFSKGKTGLEFDGLCYAAPGLCYAPKDAKLVLTKDGDYFRFDYYIEEGCII